MKKYFLILVLLFSINAFADEILIDMSGWTQNQKNMTHAMTATVLDDNGITFDNISVSNSGVITVTNPITGGILLNSVLTKENIETAYNAWKIENDAANLAAQQYEQAKQTELAGSEITNIKLSQIDAKIDSINNLAEMRVFLKKLVRYIKAKE